MENQGMANAEAMRKKLQELIADIYVYCDEIRAQRISWGDNFLPGLITKLENVLQDPLMTDASATVFEGFEAFLTAYEGKDYTLAADYMEAGVLKTLEGVVAEILKGLPLPALFEGYRPEYTSSGTVTLYKEAGGRGSYLHSNLCPMREALFYVNRFRDNETGIYHVAGLGLGYHIELLSRNPVVQVIVYEEDENMIRAAESCSDVWDLLSARKNVRIVKDEGYRKFIGRGSNVREGGHEKVCLYQPSVRTIRDEKLREELSRLFLQTDNADRWATNLAVNFHSNLNHVKQPAQMLLEHFLGKTVYLIAGGPSLDNNIALLKNRREGELVLTVGTSLRRCINEGIRPDYVIITDPKEGVYAQIAGLEDCGVPLLLLSTTLGAVAKNYRAERYMMCQKGYLPAEKRARKTGEILFETGGSVTTTALDFLIRMGVKNVVFLGLDLAFTGGKSHQGMTSANMTAQSELWVTDIYGKKVATSRNLDIYRKWIEKRMDKAVSEGCQTAFIDASEGGAKVEGTKVMKLSEWLKGGLG